MSSLALFRLAGIRRGECSRFVTAPGSKSLAVRALVLSGLSARPTSIAGFVSCDDTLAALTALERLGFEVHLFAHDVQVIPKCPMGSMQATLSVGSAGTLARFLPAVLLNYHQTFANSANSVFLVDGSTQIRSRPLLPLIASLRQLGALIEGEALPVTYRSSHLHGQCTIDGSISGQFLSGLLFAAAGSRNSISITCNAGLVQPDYVRITLRMLERAGARISADSALSQLLIHAPNGLQADSIAVESDASTACALLSVAAVANLSVTVGSFDLDSLQPDLGFLTFLSRLGLAVSREGNAIAVVGMRSQEGGAQSSLQLGSLRGGFTFDFSAMSDQALNAGILSLFCDAPVQISGIGHIRHHESDRIGCFCKNLNALGARCEERADGFVVYPLLEELQGRWPTHQDHRFVMAGLALSCAFPGLQIENVACVSKSAPEFIGLCHSIGVEFSPL